MKAMLQVQNLSVHFPTLGRHEAGVLKAVNDVSLEIKKGEIFGLTGESGSGKTTLGRTICRLQKACAGRIIFDGTDITNLASGHMGILQGKIQIVCQNSLRAMNPWMTVSEILREPMAYYLKGQIRRSRQRAHGKENTSAGVGKDLSALLEDVGLPVSVLTKVPHELSGEEQQRACIARALSVHPDFIFLMSR